MPTNYTRTGDDGTTGILGKQRLPKHALQIELLGSLDEASAALGLARSLAASNEIAAILAEVQRDLYILMAEAAAESGKRVKVPRLEASRITWLEQKTDTLSNTAPSPAGFILPGDCLAGAALALARTIIRRAERRASEWSASQTAPKGPMLAYLNRLSSLCFILELASNQQSGASTSKARPESGT